MRGEGLALLHSRGERTLRHLLPGPVNLGEGGVTVTFHWDMAARRWDLTAAAGGAADAAAPMVRAGGQMLMPPAFGDLCALAQTGDAWRHPVLRWCGVATSAVQAPPPHVIGVGTAIRTPGGAVLAGALVPGARVLTAEGDIARVAAVARHTVPCDGSLAPVRLRAGYVPAAHDILVGPGQTVMFTGTGVDYLFGAEAVLVAARDLANTRAAQRLRGPGVCAMVEVVLEEGGLLLADRVALATGCGDDDLPTLRGYEVAALLDARIGVEAV